MPNNTANPAAVESNKLTFRQKMQMFVQRSPARMAVIIAAFLFTITCLYNPKSFNTSAVGSIAMLTMLLSFAAVGQTFVLISGGLDFTVGSVMSAAAIITTTVMQSQPGKVPQVFAFALAMGAAVGLLNGLCVVKIGLPPMIVTMAISNIVMRMQYIATQGNVIGYPSPGFVKTVTTRLWGIVPTLIFYAAFIYPLVFFLLNRSRFGKQIFLVGNNAVAANLSGVKVNKIRIMAYVLSGLFAAFAGVLACAYMGLATCQMFDGYAYDSLVAVIVGGTSFTGGIGSYAGTIAGALMMTTLSNALTILQLSQPMRNIIQGLVLVALLITYNRSKKVRQ